MGFFFGVVLVLVLIGWIVKDVSNKSKTAHSTSIKWFFSPILWGTVIGGIWGVYGIPVRVPGTSSWQWVTPIGFRTASVSVFATIGFLVGMFISEMISLRRGTEPETWRFWFTPVIAILLLSGAIQYSRLQAADTENAWILVQSGMNHLFVAEQNLSKGHSDVDRRSIGVELKLVGADLGSSSRFFEFMRGQYRNMDIVASAFSQAGDTLLYTNSKPSDVKLAQHFAANAGKLFENEVLKKNGGILTPDIGGNLINDIVSILPEQYKAAGWMTN